MKEMGGVINQLAGLIAMMSQANHGIAQMQDKITKRFADTGVSLESVPIKPDDVKTSSGF